MAEIKPLRAWRYNRELGSNMEALTSPLFDVVSEKQRQTLYKNPHNSIHVQAGQLILKDGRIIFPLLQGFSSTGSRIWFQGH